MAPVAGIPARVAVGFLTDPKGATLGFVPVRSDQAHAWVEIFFPEYGWVTFEPTAGRAELARENLAPEILPRQR